VTIVFLIRDDRIKVTRGSGILEVGKGGLPPLLQSAPFGRAGASRPSLPL